jgi:hypothetical protein
LKGKGTEDPGECAIAKYDYESCEATEGGTRTSAKSASGSAKFNKSCFAMANNYFEISTTMPELSE